MEHALNVHQFAGRLRARRGRLGGRQRCQEAVHQRQVLPAHAAGLRRTKALGSSVQCCTRVSEAAQIQGDQGRLHTRTISEGAHTSTSKGIQSREL